MTTFHAGDLVLLHFPQTSGVPGARRPALVLLDSGDKDVMVARVTRTNHGSAQDVVLQDWKGAGLLAASVVRLHKVATLEKSFVQQKLGSVQANDRSAISHALAQMFGSW
jgi:mRNA interferase MazF